jgi:hypothetical protein
MRRSSKKKSMAEAVAPNLRAMPEARIPDQAEPDRVCAGNEVLRRLAHAARAADLQRNRKRLP